MKEEIDNSLWPGWETVRLIGRGSFGAVYEIERDVFGHKEKAALKVITIPQSESDIDDLMSDGYDEESITTRFEGYLHDIVREYSLMADMKGCANIVYCDDVKYIQHDNGIGWDIFIKMELLTSLTKALGKTVSDEEVVKIGTDICSALAFCEKRNLLHRDIKPQNIFVASDGTYKLGDFGIAKTAERTTSGTKTGTYKYMAPEVYNNQPYGGKADIYSLGLVLYWLLNERRTPFLPLPPTMPTSSEEDKARARRFSGEAIPAPAHGSDELQRIVLKACAYDPKDRYQSAEEMLWDLETLREIPSSDVCKLPETAETDRPSARADKDNAVISICEIGGEKADEETISAFSPGEQQNNNNETEGVLNSQKAEDATVSAFPIHFDEYESVPSSSARKKSALPFVFASVAVLLSVCVALWIFWPRYGEWSEWSATEPEAISGRVIETEREYRFRTLEEKHTTNREDVEGIIVKEENGFSEWSEWSEWFEKTNDLYTLPLSDLGELKEILVGDLNREEEIGKDNESDDEVTEEQIEIKESEKVGIDEERLYRSRDKRVTAEYSDWSPWSDWGTDALQQSDTLEVESRTVYYYPAHGYVCNSCGAVFPEYKMNCVMHAKQLHGSEIEATVGPAIIDADESTDVDAIVAGFFSRVDTTLISESANAYPDGTSTDGYAVGSPTPGAQYRFRTRVLEEKTQYTPWSEWKKEKDTETDDHEVETKVLWRFRTRIEEITFWYLGMSDWSKWSTDEISEKDDQEIETRIIYRYKDRK